jgi:hypothetical protein
MNMSAMICFHQNTCLLFMIHPLRNLSVLNFTYGGALKGVFADCHCANAGLLPNRPDNWFDCLETIIENAFSLRAVLALSNDVFTGLVARSNCSAEKSKTIEQEEFSLIVSPAAFDRDRDIRRGEGSRSPRCVRPASYFFPYEHPLSQREREIKLLGEK